MSKSVALSALGVAGTGATVTTLYMTGAFGGDSTAPQEAVIDASIAKDLAGFKTRDWGHCVKSLFPGLASMSVDPNSTAVSDDFFSKDEQKKKEVSGCLVVNWEKHEYGQDANKKWKGDFRFLWAVQQSDEKGFIVFTSAKAEPGASKQLSWEGIAYSLTKGKEESASWTIGAVRSPSQPKTMDATVMSSKFPKPHSDITNKFFWGFVPSQGGVGNICDASGCGENDTSTDSFLRGYWTWNGSSRAGKELGDWTENLSSDENSWWKEVYGDSNNWNMKNVVSSINGEWINKVWKGIDGPRS